MSKGNRSSPVARASGVWGDGERKGRKGHHRPAIEKKEKRRGCVAREPPPPPPQPKKKSDGKKGGGEGHALLGPEGGEKIGAFHSHIRRGVHNPLSFLISRHVGGERGGGKGEEGVGKKRKRRKEIFNRYKGHFWGPCKKKRQTAMR